MLTLATYPLVVHDRTEEAVAAGRKYLAYTLGAGQLLLLAIVAIAVVAPGAASGPAASSWARRRWASWGWCSFWA